MKYFNFLVSLVLILLVLSHCTSDIPDYLVEKEVTFNEAGQKLIEEIKEAYSFKDVGLVLVQDTRDSLEVLIIDLSYNENILGSENEKLRLTREIAEQFYLALPKTKIKQVYKIEVLLTKDIYDRPFLNRARIDSYPFWVQEDGSLKTNRTEFKNT